MIAFPIQRGRGRKSAAATIYEAVPRLEPCTTLAIISTRGRTSPANLVQWQCPLKSLQSNFQVSVRHETRHLDWFIGLQCVNGLKWRKNPHDLQEDCSTR